jgi:outer membrane receptor protein involved in Fe transport
LSDRIRYLVCATFAMLFALALDPSGVAQAQSSASVSGTVVHVDDRTPIEFAHVEVEGNGLHAMTDERGRFHFDAVPVGDRVLIVSWMSTGGQRVPISVTSAGLSDVTIEYRPLPLALTGVQVVGASKVPQKVVEAPVAIAVVSRVDARNYSSTGQFPQVLKGMTGMDVSLNGIHDFNVNARGFNSDLSQRVLVLMDGRDLAIPFLGAQEWSTLSVPLEDVERVEVVRGPGAALYGANAYNGVMNIITPLARDVIGNKVSLDGGELGTLRGDIRHAGVFGDGDRWGIRANAGFYRSHDWHQSRTNIGDLQREYGAVVDTTKYPVHTPAPGFEVLPLNGQTITTLPGPASGEPSPVENVYGSARLDYYHPSGAISTLEGGAASADNQVFMTNVGRFQVDHALRPWARAAWTDDHLSLMAWYSGRSSTQHSLASGAPIDEKSSLLHSEVQWNSTLNDRVSFVVGGSYRRNLVDSRGTLVAPQDDARNDWYASAFGQVKVALTPKLSLVVAGRSDGSDLFAKEFSPKAAFVFAPSANQSIRLSAGKAFQTPRITNFFLHVPLGVPADLTALENAMRTAFGSALDGVPRGTLFTQSSAVPALGLGNPSLGVEHVTSYETGYRGEFHRRVQITADAYYSIVRDFVSALLPYANSAYGLWTAPAAVPQSARAGLEAAVLGALGPGSGLTRLHDAAGTTAIVYSYGNAGRATERGVELGAGFEVTPSVHLEGNYTYFGYTVDQGVPLVPGDLIVPNTPKHKGNLRASFTRSRFDVWGGANVTTAHDWSSGFFRGRIPPSQQMDAGLGYVLTSTIRLHAIVTNLFDQRTYHIYGGSIDRRRVLTGLTGYF